ncbi:MAG: class I SAM-dependent methyltransferase [Candidatus Methylacidiphilales bacterium]|nr:class I SAM-dependent methyltransferase [Candidatus Methylacidiphilales bacterium]
MIDVFLKAGKEKSLARHHPWVFSGAIDKVSHEPAAGETVRIRSHGGGVLALAAYSPKSQIRARVWTFEAQRPINPGFFATRIGEAIARRPRHRPGTGMRLVHGESDGLPGLIVDRYGDTLVAQFLSTGAEKWREEIADALLAATGLADLYERSDADVRQLEGLTPRSGVLRGTPPERTFIEEHGIRLAVDIARGHKTGFYLDQSENRRIVRDLAAASPGMEALNCFCYTGGFSLGLLGGAAGHVLSIDSSGPALEIARANVEANGFDPARAEWREDDVFNTLREMRNTGRSFDLIVLDPPKFAPTPASVERAARAYKDINLLGFKLLKPGGRLVTFSCSGGVGAELFQKIIAGAALDAGIDALVEQRLGGAGDHPVRLAFPEGEYLKGLVLRRD